MMKMNLSYFFPFASTIIVFLHLISSQFDDPFTANLSTTWVNNDSLARGPSSDIRFIFLRNRYPAYACGFICYGTCDTYLFTIQLAIPNVDWIRETQIVWAANINNPIKENATLQFTSEGDLVLRDVDGTLVWSTNTSHKSVAGLKFTEIGNLVLFDVNNSIVWQSFDHPTDTLVPGQRLVSGQKLTARISDNNLTRGLHSLSLTNNALIAFIESNPPQDYYKIQLRFTQLDRATYMKFQNGSLDFFILSAESSDPYRSISFTPSASAQFMRLNPDGHLKVYHYDQNGWREIADIFSNYLGECEYPMVCGKYGICSDGQCSCPKTSIDSTNYFSETIDRQPNLGCSAVTPLSCNASQYHGFVELEDVTYFSLGSDIGETGINHCKEACLRNCSCKAALFRYYSDPSRGFCYLPSEIFSLMNNEMNKTYHNASVFLKVRITPSPMIRKKRNIPTLLGSITGGLILLIIIIVVVVLKSKKKKKAGETEEDYLDNVPGMPTRFSYEQLSLATENFSKKLGEGGFGSVFEGVLKDNTKIAVKCLEGIGRVKKSFLAEVESIGSIHHINLVRLIGFCAENSHRLLVYEYMSNGSLDRWIYSKNQDVILEWKCRRKIIQDVSKGLAYLHEDCRQKIVHLDIKPQNILLEENFNAKISDFGLSKLIERDQSQVVTLMRGTPGYMAPEWLGGSITEKVDVYSFGIMVLEILCGRKNFELAAPEEHKHLPSLFKMKAEEGRLSDLIDQSEDMQSHGTEVLEIMQVVAWCLQSDYAKRPSMSMVVKVLEGVMEIEKDVDYSLLNSHSYGHKTPEHATPLLPSLLSGPR